MLIYVAIATVGFVLLLVMLVGGDLFGADHDIAGHEVSVDHGDAGGPSIFSVRIMSSFLTAFGVGGVVARYYGLSHPASSVVGVVVGGVMSSAVYQFAKVLYSQQASSEIHMATLVGTTAEVSIAIPAGGVGQITVTHSGERSEHIARSGDGLAIPRGALVTVTSVAGDAVSVSRQAGVTSSAAGGGK